MLPRLTLALLCAALPLLPAHAQPTPTATTLSADTLSAPAHTLIHLTATVYAASLPAGSIAFFDNAQPLITLPLDSQGTSILGIASLPAGPHTFTATYSGSSATASSTSAPLPLTVTPLPTALALSTPTPTTYAGTPLTLTAAALPVPATGTISLSNPTSTSPAAGASTPRLQTFGDSITAATSPTLTYPTLLASSLGLALTNYATPAATVCDILPTQILPGTLGPTQSAAPLSTLMAGTWDALNSSTPSPSFTACLQSTLAWLAIPREYKLLPADPAITTLGSWQSSTAYDTATYGTLFNASGSGTARITITTTGQPIYLWHLLADSLSGTFTLTLDGVPTGITYATQPSPALGSSGVGYALLRFPVAAGVHAIDLTVRSGAVGILAAATPPSPGVASVHPTLLVTDVPNQDSTRPAVAPDVIARYSSTIQSAATLLQSDTLDIRFTPTHTYLTGSPAEFTTPITPSALGHQHLAAALEAALANTPTAPFASFIGQPTPITLTLNTPGSYTLQAAYSGDPIYASSTSNPLAITVLPQNGSATTLSAPRTRFTTRTAIPFTAAVTPSTATGSVTLYDGTAWLAQSPLTSGTAAFTTSTLTPGLHNLAAVYSGDSPDTPSASPPLTVEIDRYSPTLTLTPLPATQTYATPQLLTTTIQPADATGLITFTDTFLAPSQSNPTLIPLGQSPLTAGAATLATANLPVGTHTITATYPGDSLDLPATSDPLIFTITATPSTLTLTSPAATLSYGSTAVLTAALNPSAATGTITLRDSITSTLTSAPLSNGVASFSISNLSVGPHTFTALYPGDATTAPSTSQPLTLQVTRAPTTLTLAPPPATLLAGTPLTLTATLSPADSTGTITFRDATTGTLGQSTIAGGVATLTLPSLGAGSYSVTAAYSGDPTHAPSTSPAISAVISLNPATLTLTPSRSTLPLGAPLQLTAGVTPPSATGPILFSDTAAPLATASLAAGSATVTLTNLPAGPHTLRATYPGDPLNSPAASAPITVTIAPDPTTTTLTLAQLSIPTGSPAIFNVRVDSLATSTPAGTVLIRSGALTLATGTLANAVPGTGYVTLSTPTGTLPVGTYPITAAYMGSLADTPSTSATATLSIVPIPTAATLTLTRSVIPIHSSIALTATVAATSLPIQTPTGALTFLANNVPFANLPLDSAATATATFTPPLPGVYAFTAAYTPTGPFAPAATTSQLLNVTLPLTLTVNPAALDIAPASAQSTTLTITPLSGFTGPITTACASANAFITCSVDSPAALTGPLPVNAVLHIRVAPGNAVPRTALLLLTLPLLLARRRRLPPLLASTLFLLTLSGCAEGGNFGAIPPGAYAVTVTCTAAGTVIPATVAVTIPPAVK